MPNCPVCQTPLELKAASLGHLCLCTSCAGIWVDNATAQRVVAGQGGAVPSFRDCEASATALDFLAPRSSTGAPCPVCAAPLQAVFLPQANTEVDICVPHGTWFERRELRRVAEAYARGATGFPNLAPAVRPAEDHEDQPYPAEEERDGTTALAVDVACDVAILLANVLARTGDRLEARDDVEGFWRFGVGEER